MARPFRTLLWKEWRQLRVLRVGGALLVAIMPSLGLLLAELAELAARGWLSIRREAPIDVVAFVTTAAPVASAIGFALIVVAATGSAHVADRAGDLESFLLSRPVTRGQLWRARSLAALGTTLLVGIVGAAGWAALMAGTVTGSHDLWADALMKLGIGYGLGAVLGFLSASLAAVFVDAPLGVVLLAMVLPVVPVGLAYALSEWFPLAALQTPIRGPGFDFPTLPLGAPAGLLVVIAFGVVPWIAVVRGEPAGIHRRRRGAIASAVGIACVVAMFAAATPLVLRHEAWRAVEGGVAGPVPGRAALESRLNAYWSTPSPLGVWILDTRTGRVSRMLTAGGGGVTWRPDGARLATFDAAGSLGSIERPGRLLIVDGATARIDRAIPLVRVTATVDATPEDDVSVAAWTDSGLLLLVRSPNEPPKFVRLEPGSGRLRALSLEEAPRGGLTETEWRLRKVPGGSGTFLMVERGSETISVYRLDETRDTVRFRFVLDATPASDPDRLALAPSGRLWVEDETRHVAGRPGQSLVVHEARSGRTWTVQTLTKMGRRAAWLAGDRLVWPETSEERTSIRIWSANDGARELATLRADCSPYTVVAPDGRRIVVACDDGDETAVVNGETGITTRLVGPPKQARYGVRMWCGWADPVTLSWGGLGAHGSWRLALEPIDRPGRLIWVRGGPP